MGAQKAEKEHIDKEAVQEEQEMDAYEEDRLRDHFVGDGSIPLDSPYGNGISVLSSNNLFETEADKYAQFSVLRNPYRNKGLKKEAIYSGSITALGDISSMLEMYASAKLSQSLQSRIGKGSLLGNKERSLMENQLGMNLSEVRIHNDSFAASMNRELGSQAFAYGNNVFFGSNAFQPTTSEGFGLLAHEVAHTQQQSIGNYAIQRALKFEIQTSNLVWQVNEKGDVWFPGRKYGAYGLSEDGDIPTYLVAGRHGTPAPKEGEEYFKPVQGKYVTKPQDTDSYNPYTKVGVGDMAHNEIPQITEIYLVKNRSILSGKRQPEMGKDMELLYKKNRGVFYNAINSEEVWYRYFDEKPDFLLPFHERFGLSSTNGITERIFYDEKEFRKHARYAPVALPRKLPYHIGRDGRFVTGLERYQHRTVETSAVDASLPAHLVMTYQLKRKNLTEEKIIGKKPGGIGGLIKLSETDNSSLGKRNYNRNTFGFIYYTNEGIRLKVHVDEFGRFQRGEEPFMHLERSRKKGFDYRKEPEVTEVWRVRETIGSANGNVAFYDYNQSNWRFVFLEEVEELRQYAKDEHGIHPKKDIAKGTVEKRYFWDADIVNDEIREGAFQLDVHLDDARLVPGHVKYMKKKKKAKGSYKYVIPRESKVRADGKIIEFDESKSQKVFIGKEQTGIELQVEAGGFLEFETPKWFATWEEMQLRIQDAIRITEMLSPTTNPNLKKAILSDAQLNQMREVKRKDSHHGKNAEVYSDRIYEWPEELLDKDVKKRLNDKGRKLMVELVYPDWPAFFQTSEGIPIKNFSKLAQDYMTPKADGVQPGVSDRYIKMTEKAVELGTKSLQKGKRNSGEYKDFDNSLFQNLEGFLQLLYLNIFMANNSNSRNYPIGKKYYFGLLTRTNLGQVHENSLSDDEQALFKQMVSKGKVGSTHAILSSELEESFLEATGTTINLTKKTFFYSHKDYRENISKVKGKISYKYNFTMYNWLRELTKNTDLMIGSKSKISAALGAQDLETEPGGKKYNLTRFEKRKESISMPAKGDPEKGIMSWEEYAKLMYERAYNRSADTPDDPSTKKNESSKTSLRRQ